VSDGCESLHAHSIGENQGYSVANASVCRDGGGPACRSVERSFWGCISANRMQRCAKLNRPRLHRRAERLECQKFVVVPGRGCGVHLVKNVGFWAITLAGEGRERRNYASIVVTHRSRGWRGEV